jgi:hypothetical protein
MWDSGSRRARTKFDLAEARRLVILAIVAVIGSLLVADYSRVPTDPVRVGDVATRSIKAPFKFSYQDEEAMQRARSAAGSAALPVFLFREGLLTESLARLDVSFRAARQTFEAETTVPATEEQEASTRRLTGERRDEIAASFIRDLGVLMDADVLRPLVVAGFPREAEQLVARWLADVYGDALVLTDRSHIPGDERPLMVVPQVGDRDTFVLSDYRRVKTTDEIRQLLTLAALRQRGEAPWGGSLETVATALIGPNLFFDAERTSSARADAESRVVPQPVVVKRGETLFREGDKITPVDVAKYNALQRSRSDHGLVSEASALWAFLMLVFVSLHAATRRILRSDVDDTRDTSAVGLLVVLTALLARGIVASSSGIAELLGNQALPESIWYLAPVAAGAMLARVLMNRLRATFYALAASIICGLMMGLDALYVVYFLLTCAVAVTVVEPSRERIAVLGAGVWTGVFGALTVLLIHFVQLYVGEGELSLAVTIRPIWSMLFAFAGGIFSSFLVLALIPIFETLGFVTDYRMLELASLNHPLMRKLMLRAPGTYHHSVVVGTLAEAACEAIGANSLQAKISAYFHDIGKVRKPQYFVENQRGGANRHNDLSPAMSAKIIIDHVVDGARMAREHNLPKPILDNIQMHHGTGLLQYFFAKAQMEADDPATIDEADYRYPGPKPNTRESGVVMLADKVEAATRTIKVPTEENIRAMINRIINSVMADDQFSECPLTFREIYTIADTFVQVLLGIYHQRIEYPQTHSISTSGARRDASESSGEEVVEVGTITLELETSPVALASKTGDVWAHELRAEDTDYESVRNLPLGEP